MRLPPNVAAAFGVDGDAVPLEGGEGRTYRVGDLVLRREADAGEAEWIASLFSQLTPGGFRISRPAPTRQGDWLAAATWSAWTFVEGRAATQQDLPEVIPAIEAFHAALATVPWHAPPPRPEDRFTHADRLAWREALPVVEHPEATLLLEELYAVREPLPPMPEQLIHGDLNPDNILVCPGQAPAIIDLAPYWRPAGFASAIAAYWFGPYAGDANVLSAFSQIPLFPQLLVRAATRMLLSWAAAGQQRDLERYRAATHRVCEFARNPPD
jgi:uncharacterized protein (TIGR02569 family)